MVKCKAIIKFTLQRFKELKNIKRFKDDEEGTVFINDIFECTKDLAKYLLDNKAIEILEVIPDTPVDNVDKIVDKPKRGRRKKILDE